LSAGRPLFPRLHFRPDVHSTDKREIKIEREHYNFEDEHQQGSIWWDLFSDTSAETGSTEKQNSESLTKAIDGALFLKPLSSKDSPIASILSSKPEWLPESAAAWRSAADDQFDIPPTLSAYLDGRATLNDFHSSKVQELWDLMKNRLRYISDENALSKIKEALRIAYLALFGKKTARSMEISINRARGIAAVLGELKADTEVILAGILHEVLSEEATEHEKISRCIAHRFGDDVLDLAKKYTHLPKFKAQKAEYTLFQSESHLQMLVAVAEDYRTLYIRLADRLHTLRVLKSLPLEDSERLKIAQEALHVYAPLAHRMAVMKVKGELEDLAFRVLDPVMFQQTRYTQVAAHKAYHEAAAMIQHIISSDKMLSANQTSFRVTYRIKDKYQLYLKMTRKNLSSLAEVRDALGLRIIIGTARLPNESPEDHEKRGHSICYRIMDGIKNMEGWEPAEKGYKDYIKGKKENGYQSLHQYMRHKSLGANVEFQVRTKEMHLMAELGDAAHWFYKDQMYRTEVADSKLYKVAWRSPQQANAKSAAELMGMAKQQLSAERVFVFLDDKATVMNLKKGATALDAAFAIHSELGLRTKFVNIGGIPVDVHRPLKNGDIISVQTTGDHSVAAKPFWLTVCKSTTASMALRKYFRDNTRTMNICLGCVQLLMTMTLNPEVIREYYQSDNVPGAHVLVENIKQRTSFKNIGEFLQLLGTVSTKHEMATMMGSLLGIPCDELTVCNPGWSLMWARMQGRNGWEDKQMRNDVLIPLLRDILPGLYGHLAGNISVEQKWTSLVGARSLTDERSPYFESLSAHMKRRKAPEAAPVAAISVEPTVATEPRRLFPISLPIGMQRLRQRESTGADGCLVP
jgi:GTP pyrophosphokinase